MSLEFETCWRAVRGRDTRFDGVFFCAVITTRIYCRPSCPGMPKRQNVRFYGSAAQAQAAGFRSCKRCRPDAAPGSPDWDVRADLVGRALRLIADGVVDRGGVSDLAHQLGYTTRHLHRQMVGELGVGPRAVARARRAQTARTLLETTNLRMGDVAAGAGFASVRQFNDTVHAVFGMSPTDLRRTSSDPGPAATGSIAIALPVRTPFDGVALLEHLASEAIPGLDEVDAGTYRRSLGLPSGLGVAHLRPGPAHVDALLELDDVHDLPAAIHRCRRVLDLDADPRAITESLTADDAIAPLVSTRPGLRVPGHVDHHELAVRAALCQHLGRDDEREVTAWLTRRYGRCVTAPRGRVTHVFPEPATLAATDCSRWPIPSGAATSALAVSSAIASGDVVLGDGADRDVVRDRLSELTDPDVAGLVLLRGLKDPDVFLGRHPRTLEGLAGTSVPVDTASQRWRPWRSYAMWHLWHRVADAASAPDG